MLRRFKLKIKYYFYSIFFKRGYLDHIANSVGLERKHWETDKKLRQRIEIRLRTI